MRLSIAGPLLIQLVLAVVHLAIICCGSAEALSNSAPSSSLFIFGLGRVGLECGRQSLPHFDVVRGTVRRNEESSKEAGADKITRILIADREAYQKALQGATHVLWTIPLQMEPDPALQTLWNDFVGASKVGWKGFVSTTGVYGNHNGNWVTEESDLKCTPQSNAHLYKQAEEELWQRQSSFDGIVSSFRCAGIYDAHRSALHTVYRQGRPPRSSKSDSDAMEETPTNRIHTHDIARAIVASMVTCCSDSRGKNTPLDLVYNLADDEPAPRSLVLNYAADLLQGILPNREFEVEAPSASTTTTRRERRRLSDRKLVSNRRVKEELLPNFIYPTYREGLEAILLNPDTPWNQEASMSQNQVQ